MEHAQTAYRLKDGRCVTVRSPGKQDAQAILDCLDAISRETEYLLRSPEDEPVTIKEEAAFLQRALLHPRSLFLAAFWQGEAVAACNFAPVSDRAKARHRAQMGLGVRAAFWRQGLARHLVRLAMDSAAAAGIAQVELGVYEGNAPALSLYRGLGFAPFGRVPHAFLHRDGSLHDEILMVKDLARGTPPPLPLDAVVLDTDDVPALLDFYCGLLNWEKKFCEPSTVAAAASPCGRTRILLQYNPHYVPPVWPDAPQAQQQQAHLDFEVYTQEDMRRMVERAKALGAREPACQYGVRDGKTLWYTLLDPAGHPFCLVIW